MPGQGAGRLTAHPFPSMVGGYAASSGSASEVGASKSLMASSVSKETIETGKSEAGNMQ